MTVCLGILAALLSLLAVLLLLSAGLLALSVMLSFSIAWYEQINLDPALAAECRHSFAVRLMVTEFACLLATLLLRPLGWLPARTPAGSPQRPPVVLLHGLFQNRSCLLPLQWRLWAAGYNRVISVNTPPWRDLETLLDTVAATITTVRQRSGNHQVILVGHSMGGILARCFLQLRGGAPQVAACVTLGSPHHGSKLAPFAVTRLGRALLPGSVLLARLNEGPLPAGVAFTSIYSRHDNIIVPPDNARLDGADNLELAGMGHAALLFSSQAAKAVVTALDKHVLHDP
jgi:triacylglycerol esterase/lipase EstA (alpha/beta hydrolase family)